MLINNIETDRVLLNLKWVAAVMITNALERHYSDESSRKVRISWELNNYGHFIGTRETPRSERAKDGALFARQ